MTTLTSEQLGDNRSEVLAGYRAHLGRAQSFLAVRTALPVEARAEGSSVWDTAGTRYLHCGGFGVFFLGHRHPHVVAAVHRQLDVAPLSSRALLSGEQAAAARALVGYAPVGLERVYFGCSGGEAVDTALKLVRAAGRRRLLSVEGSFHGKTMGALSVTNQERFQAPFRPLLPDTTVVPFGDIAAVRGALATAPGEFAVVVEPVQGEGGVRIPPPGYLRGLRQACDDAGALLVVDEVQTGLGRLGLRWGVDAEGVSPDVLVVGKVLGGGCLPVSAVVATPAAFGVLDRDPRAHTSTFSGYPLGMAAASATLEVLADGMLVERAASLGAWLLREVSAVLQPFRPELVAEVRGRGLLIGIELASKEIAAAFARELTASGVIPSYSMGADAVVRLTPPAVLTDTEAEQATAAVLQAIQQTAASLAPRVHP